MGVLLFGIFCFFWFVGGKRSVLGWGVFKLSKRSFFSLGEMDRIQSAQPTWYDLH